jgi:RNase H
VNGPVQVATDGACPGNPGPGGWAWTTGTTHASGGQPVTTNQEMELRAILEALRARPAQPIVILTDSQYAIDWVTTWLPGWRRNGWRTSARRRGDLPGPRRCVQPGGGAIAGGALVLGAHLPGRVDAELAGGQAGRLDPGRAQRGGDLLQRAAARLQGLPRGRALRLDAKLQQGRVGDRAGQPLSHDGDRPLVGGRGCGLGHGTSPDILLARPLTSS